MDTLFFIASVMILPFWLLMIFAPNWGVTHRIIGSLWIVAPSAILFTVVSVPGIPALLEQMWPTLAATKENLSQDVWVVSVWSHITAIDLIAGRYLFFDSQQRGYSKWLMGPLLLLTFRFSPMGVLSYLILVKLRPGPEPEPV